MYAWAGQEAKTADQSVMYVSRMLNCFEISDEFDPEDLGVLAKLFHTKMLRQLQVTELMSPKNPWSRAMSQAFTHYINFKAEECAHRPIPKCHSADLHCNSTQ